MVRHRSWVHLSSLAWMQVCQERYNHWHMSRIKSHIKVFFYAVVFGMAAYGIIKIGIALHQFFVS